RNSNPCARRFAVKLPGVTDSSSDYSRGRPEAAPRASRSEPETVGEQGESGVHRGPPDRVAATAEPQPFRDGARRIRVADPDRAGRVAVLRVGAGRPRRGERPIGGAPLEGEPLARARRELPGDLLVDRPSLGERGRVGAAQLRRQRGRAGDHSPAHDRRGTRHVDERGRQQPARERLGERDPLTAPRELGDDTLGERVHGHPSAFAARVTRHASHRYCAPLTTVSARAMPMRLQLTHSIQSPSTAHSGTRANDSAIACATVLSLPSEPAGMTWSRSIAKRKIVMPNSRTRITIVTHHHSSPRIESVTSAAPTRILSAIGSTSLPKSVTRLRLRARKPSTESVVIERMNRAPAIQRYSPSSPPSSTMSHTNT